MLALFGRLMWLASEDEEGTPDRLQALGLARARAQMAASRDEVR